ncbi:MAG: (d)CMP kinase [Candidatus Cloacimonetes bacterium]|jgi:cytidylate kinase|nr:(d)CMP kinase [Candidatus Cloacimonadota bacterium]MDD2506590.1 (d)CMP kinase [Candidatus Cloacimonadota bacterium]MDD4147054.1 (d)CMP kinase [Candidatus Cloacimonadota bacterium]MDD4560208.1 (d)CMP kinase [Candidatus Cloacimonadota bacterium]
MSRIIIAIDGPAASGKSTAAKLLAGKLGYVYLDTGAMYRACGLAAKQSNTDIEDPQALSILMNSINIEIQYNEQGNRTILNHIDVSQAIREPEISRLASAISAKRLVREKMVELQRQMGKNSGVILDGRDIGTVVFPQAELKFFLIAPVEVRAKRRYLELKEKGLNPDYEVVLREMEERDKADSSRALAPLVPASDAIQIDTGSLTIDGQVDLLYCHYLKRMDELCR